MKYLKILTLLFNIIGFGVSIYYKLYLLTVFLFLLFFYFLYIFAKKREYTRKNNFNKRAMLSSNILLFFVLLIVIRLVQIQIFNEKYYDEKVKSQIKRNDIFYGNRGDIYDSNGKSLAFNQNIYTLGVNPSALYDRDTTLKGIEAILDKPFLKKDKAKILKELEEGYQKRRKYKVIAKNLTEHEREEIQEIIREYHLTLNEVQFDRSIKRTYYKRDLYDNLIGFIGYTQNSNSEKVGVFGLEKEYEKYLKEISIKRQNIYTKNRKIKLPFSQESIKTNLDGKNIHTTIDNDIQFILNEEVRKKFISSGSEEAYGVIMDPNTGKVLATTYHTIYKNKALRNPIFQNQMEPGSIFKPIIVASALDANLITRASKFDIGEGRIKKYNHTIREASRSTRGILSTDEVLTKSSNVGMVMIGDKFTNQEFEEYLKRFGFYDKTGIDFPGELKPYTTPYKRWDGLKKSTMSFGQGIVVTPIQMITAFSSLINGGILYKPYLVDKITDEEGVVIRRNLPTPVRQTISKELSKDMREILEKTVTEGTVKKGRVEGYRVGGKSGTAQLSTKGGYLKENYLSSVIGFFPVDKPKYTILVMFLKPKGETIFEKFGGAKAAPVFGDIVRRISKSKNILSENISSFSKVENFESPIKNETIDVVMPDLTGFSPKEVVYIFKDTNIEVKIKGVGLVKEQYPKAGTPLENIKEIKIVLE
ncbi:penicillin-binding protein [uncultured Fusobacterium sp.]|uniref:penicillin-binding protein n=1 Tax=uncultured Fusobacterium sp. TaxID=159267 RepID=UPI0025ED63C8|nr:penicillin-binding protein [uncultured Fusobacterium sp.]